MRQPEAPTRGSGGVACCGYHRAQCVFGHAHVWSVWYENARLQRTRDTYHCHTCGGVCIADEEEAGECAICVPGQCPGPDCPGNYSGGPAEDANPCGVPEADTETEA